MRTVLKMMALEMKMVMIVSRAIVTDTTARAGVHALHCLLLIRPLGKRKYTLHPHLSHQLFRPLYQLYQLHNTYFVANEQLSSMGRTVIHKEVIQNLNLKFCWKICQKITHPWKCCQNTNFQKLPKFCQNTAKFCQILPKLPTLYLVKMMWRVAFLCTFVVKATIAHLLTEWKCQLRLGETIKRSLQKNLGICNSSTIVYR